MSQTSAASRTFFARANDLRCRSWAARLSRFARARLRNFCAAGLLFSDDPRVCTAWRRGWDAGHYLRLLRWRDEGFRPRVIYDIGAHLGAWSEMVQAIFAPETIFLFEPQADFREKLIRRQPAEAKWKVIPVALGDQEGTQWINVTENSAASSLLTPMTAEVPATWGTTPVRREEVKVATLDGLAASRSMPLPDLVKIDVQG